MDKFFIVLADRKQKSLHFDLYYTVQFEAILINFVGNVKRGNVYTFLINSYNSLYKKWPPFNIVVLYLNSYKLGEVHVNLFLSLLF